MDESKDSLNFYDLGAPVPVLAAGLSPEDRAGLVSAPKNKRQGLATMRKRIKRLEKIQSQYNELEAKFFKERAALEDKYQKLYEPLYTKRYKIVNGVAKENAAETKNKGLPGFWLNVMKANEVLTRTINKQDEKALKFLKDIKYSRISVPKGFKLEFFFNSNPYFKNSVLTKSFRMADGHAFAPFPMNMMGTEIEWYPGNCLTREILTKRPMKRSKCWTSYWSFFDFFSTIQIPFYDEEMVERIDDEYIIASTIRDRIIPSAVSWFHEEDAQDDDFQDLVGDDCDEEDEDEEEEDEDEEEEEEEDEDEEEEEDEDDNERFHTHCMMLTDARCFVRRSPSPESVSNSEFFWGKEPAHLGFRAN